jgi:predicted dehydrogenase
MGERLGWGILGTGGIARIFTKDLLGAGFSVAAVGSRSKAGAEAFGREFGVAHQHGSYEELCTDPAVAIVYVATPHPFHHANARTALEAGKHVLVEKPFTLNAAEARDITALAKGRGLFIMEAMWTRFLPTMTALRTVISDGTLGDLTALIADHCQYIPRERASRLHLPELGGGALLDLGVYPVSFAHDLFGSPSRVQAAGKLTALGVDERVSLILDWPSGAQASIHMDMLARGPNKAVVIGSKARIEIDSIWYCPVPFTVIDRDGVVLYRYEEKITGRGMQYQAVEVERCVREGLTESPTMSHSESIEVMTTLDVARSLIGVRYPGEITKQ